jgi:hypothetical protein
MRSSRFWIWISCVLLFAYLPLWYGLTYQWLHHSSEVVDELFGKGDLVLIACAVMADGFGRTALAIKRGDVPATGFAFAVLIFSFLVIVGSVIIYSAGRGPSPALPREMQIASFALMAVTTVLSGVVILGVEGDE